MQADEAVVVEVDQQAARGAAEQLWGHGGACVVDYRSRNACSTVASIRHMVMGLTGDSMKPRDR